MKSRWPVIVLIILILIGLAILSLRLFTKPSNNRPWEVGMETLPKFVFQDSQVSITNIRDYHYQPGRIVSFGYINRTINLADVQKTWFVVEPFSKFKQVAHTYFVFDIVGQDPIVVSVEARRQSGQSFNMITGLLNQYELIYIWGSETDETIRRVIVENNKLYMYPLTISPASTQKLFLQLAQTSHQLESQPRFYNTLTSNCTNELAKAANTIKPGAIPFDLALFFPGYSAQLLYSLGYLPRNLPLNHLTQKYFISETVKQIYNQPDFSAKLRASF